MGHFIPDHWKQRLQEYALATSGEARDYLMAYDFKGDQHVSLRFPDGSYAMFRYAFYLEDEKEVAVFTEHCGYHYFPAGELIVERLQTLWTEQDQNDE